MTKVMGGDDLSMSTILEDVTIHLSCWLVYLPPCIEQSAPKWLKQGWLFPQALGVHRLVNFQSD